MRSCLNALFVNSVETAAPSPSLLGVNPPPPKPSVGLRSKVGRPLMGVTGPTAAGVADDEAVEEGAFETSDTDAGFED